jgi:hypothetical protein
VSVTEPDPPAGGDLIALESPGRWRRVATIVVVVGLIVSIVALAFVSGRGVVQPPPSPSILAATRGYLAIVDADGHLLTTDEHGDTVAALGDDGTTYAFPAWSPDGTHIAAIGRSAGDGIVTVFEVSPDGTPSGDPLVVYRDPVGPPFYVYWSSDGRWIGFLTTETDSLALRVVPADGHAAAEVVHQGSPLYWAWSGPDRVLIHSGGSGPDAYIGETGIGGDTAPGPTSGLPGPFRAPAVSMNGLRAYATFGDATSGAVVIEEDGGARRTAVDVFGSVAIDFSPVADQLAILAPAGRVASGGLPIGRLRVLDGRSGDIRTILPGSVVMFDWSPDGRSIAALRLDAIDRDDVASGGLTMLAAARPAPFDAADIGATRFTLSLVFIDVATGDLRSERDVTLTDLFVGQVLPYFDQYALSHRMWSADSGAIVLPLAAADDTTQLTVIEADGSRSTSLPGGVFGVWRP